MNAQPLLTGALALGLMASASAQIAVGASAPALEFKSGWNDAPGSWKDLRGQVVILKFTQTW